MAEVMEAAFPSRQKRKRIVLTFRQKVDILQKLDQGKRGHALAREYGIGISTISDIRRNKDSILQHVIDLGCNEEKISVKKTRKTAQNVDMEATVYQWYLQLLSEGTPVSGAALCVKALEVNRTINGDPKFKATNGWLKHFRTRHSISIRDGFLHQIPNDSFSDTMKKLSTTIKREGYQHENIYNADEMILKWKSLPQAGDEHTSDNFAILTCSNAAGTHNLPLLVIGRRALKKKMDDNTDFVYRQQINAWMDMALFTEWYENVFIPEVKKKQVKRGTDAKVLLILDNTPYHPYGNLVNEEAKFKVFFIPMSISAEILPMDQGIKTELKTIYRRKLLELVRDKGYEVFDANFNHYDGIALAVEAWSLVSRNVLLRAWRRLLHDSFDEEAEIISNDFVDEWLEVTREIPVLKECDRDSILRWFDADKDDPSDPSLSEPKDPLNTDSCDSAEPDLNEEEMEDENEEETVETDIPTHAEVHFVLGRVKSWLAVQEESDSRLVESLEVLMKLAETKICAAAVKEET